MLKDNELNKIIECMGEVCHNKWMETRAKQGFHNPEFCPERQKEPCWSCRFSYGITGKKVGCTEIGLDFVDITKDCDLYKFKPCSKCNPCMVPYTELSEEEKELDRDYPREFIKSLETLGYEIVKKDNRGKK